MNKLILAIVFVFQFVSLKAYWQQEVKYNIKVEVDDTEKHLYAKERIVYINNSPDTLTEMYFHQWPNAYQPKTPLAKQILEQGNTKLHFEDPLYQGSLYGSRYKINGKQTSLKPHEFGREVAWFDLPEPLNPGDSIVITTPFTVELPKGEVSRMGFLDGSYQATQWYPKPAVYDKNGWNVMPYLSIGEFYSEYGTFDVSIKIPEAYEIAASGNLVNSKIENGFKTESYHIENVHDFAWFADTTWIIETSEVILPHSGRTVKTYMKYKPEHIRDYKNSVQFVDSAVYYYSLWVGDYPYNICGAVDGGLTAGAGMEYPTVTVLGDAGGRAFHEEVTVHEVGHNWFYGILGSNERKNPWMDEGINSYYERRYYEEVKSDLDFYDFVPPLQKILRDKAPKQTEFHHYAHDFVNTRNIDQPANLPAPEYSDLNYASIVYSKTAVSLNYLEKYLGKKLFDEIMQDYFNTWKFKHPQPEDFKTIFKKHTDKNLDWFFEDLLTTSYPLDYKIHNAGYTWDNEKFEVTVSNNADIAGPFSVSALKNGKVVNTAWYEGYFGISKLDFPYGDYDEVIIDYYHDLPEINRKNNRFQLYHVLGMIEPFEAARFYNFNKLDRTQAFFTPLVGYNLHDDLQIGVAATNLSIQEQPFRYMLMPQFAFGTNKLVGSGQLVYSIYPAEYFNKVNMNFNYRRQGLDLGVVPGQMEKIEGGLNFMITNPNARSSYKSNFRARVTNIEVSFDRREASYKNYITFDYNAENKRAVNPYDAKIMMQAFDQNWKFTTEFNYGLTINSKEKKIEIRGFAGWFLQKPNSVYTEAFNLNGNNGSLYASSDLEVFNYTTPDYLFENSYYGRFITDSKSLGRQQIAIQDGGFKSGMGTIRSSTWMGSLNFVLPLPTKYVSLYSDIGVTDQVWVDYASEEIDSPILYDFGIQLNIIKNYCEIYLPLGYSEAINTDYEIGINGLGDDPTTAENEFNYLRRIKFMVNINKIYSVLQ